ISRAMVNLAATPGDTIIDPCCGVGSIPLEAWAAGMRAVGADINPKLAGMTADNLAHFGWPRWVCAADAGTFGARGDVVVTDFPYGRQSTREDGLYERLLANFRCLAPKLVLVVAEDVSDLLEQAGYRLTHVTRVPTGHEFERRIHVAEVVA
ncbi:MAG TPA: RNA methyltransferase, partial [Armatimonadota bacterium]|nr:RNA methyltransferase [Armatimonadota bacterium]